MLVSLSTANLTGTRRRGSRAQGASMSREGVLFPFTVWVVHWLLITIPATLAYHWGTSQELQTDTYVRFGTEVEGGTTSWAYQGTPSFIPGPMTGLAHWLVEPMRLWDGSWYRLVANDWYGPNTSAYAAFFPLYPKLMQWLSDVTGWSTESSGYVISNVAFLGALIVLYRLVSMDFSEAIARRTVWILALFPFALFFNAVYTESLFLLLAVGTLYAARRGEWLAAGIVGLLAALTRSAGVMLLAPMAVLFIQQYGWNPRRWFPNAIPAALPALGPVIFGWILTRNDMKFFDWIDQQWQWNRFSANPVQTFNCTINGCQADVRQFGNTVERTVNPMDLSWLSMLVDSPTWGTVTSFEWRDRVARGDVFEFIVTVLAIILVLIGLKQLPLYYSAFTIPALLVPMFSPSQVHPLMSMPRFVLPLFPLFVMAALLLNGSSARTRVALGVVSAALSIFFTMQFVLWYWVS
jgi:hypothetical protein